MYLRKQLAKNNDLLNYFNRINLFFKYYLFMTYLTIAFRMR